jgi:hypothetical protein
MGAFCKEMVGDCRLALVLSSLAIEPSLEGLELSESLEPLSVLSVPSLPSLLLVLESKLSSQTTASPGTGKNPLPLPCPLPLPLPLATGAGGCSKSSPSLSNALSPERIIGIGLGVSVFQVP